MAIEAGIAVGSAGYRATVSQIAAHRDRREEKAQLIEALEIALVTAHDQRFARTTTPARIDPELTDRGQVRKQHRDQAAAHLRKTQLRERRAAKLAADQAAAAWCDAEDARRTQEAQAAYARASRLWSGLQVNRRAAVLYALERAFEDNAMPAFAVDCSNGVASIVVITGPNSSLPDETVERNPAGKPRFVKRRDHLTLHRDSVFSNLLATADEALAVAPALLGVQLICLERRESKTRREPKLVPLCLLRTSGTELAALDWTAEPREIIGSLQTIHCNLDAAGHGLQKLDISDEPDVAETITAIAEALGCRS